MPSNTSIALLRGINVSGHNKIPMSELRECCGELGWRDVQTYIQSGNVLFRAAGAQGTAEANLEHAIEHHFGLRIPVLVRTAAQWRTYVRGNPFPEASESAANAVMLCLSKAAPNPDAQESLRERAQHGEEVVQVRDAIWIHFAEGVAKSKLSPAVLDRLVGSVVTARNWRTVSKLAELAGVE